MVQNRVPEPNEHIPAARPLDQWFGPSSLASKTELGKLR